MEAYKGQFEKGWAGDVGVCGPGSDEKYAKPSRERLKELISRFDNYTNPPVILEIGCGDTLWHGDEFPKYYIGIDLHSRPEWEMRTRENGAMFEVVNVLEMGDLPDASIIIARNVFIHLSNEAILSTLIKCFRTGAKYLLTSNDKISNSNDDRHKETYCIRAAGLDLTQYPFYLDQDPKVENAYLLNSYDL